MKRLCTIFIIVFSLFVTYDCLFADDIGQGSVNKKYLRVRKNPNSKSEIKETLKRNDSVTVLETSGKWYKIKTSSNKGWVKSKYISSSSIISIATSTPTIATYTPTDTENPNLEPQIKSSFSTNSLMSTTSSVSTQSAFDDSYNNRSPRNNEAVLPKMNKTATKIKLQEVSKEKAVFNKNEEY